MATKLLSPCRNPGCPNLTGRGLCTDHRRAYERSAERRQAKAYYNTADWQARRRFTLARDPVCTDDSGCTAPSTEADHVIPRSAGGSDEIANLRGLCKPHHSRKTANDGGWGPKKFPALSS